MKPFKKCSILESGNITYSDTCKPLNSLINSINATFKAGMIEADIASDKVITKLKAENVEIKQENFNLKDELEVAEDTLAELKNISTKTQLADLLFIQRRKAEDFSKEINEEIKIEKGREVQI